MAYLVLSVIDMIKTPVLVLKSQGSKWDLVTFYNGDVKHRKYSTFVTYLAWILKDDPISFDRVVQIS